MGRRGPRPQPTVLKLVRGNPGKRRLNTSEPEPLTLSRNLPPPTWLDDMGKGKWRELVPKLRALGMLTAIDLGALASYCWCYSEFRRADTFLKEHGHVMTLRDDKGNVKYRQVVPEASMAKNMIAEMRRYEQEFGLTPSARSSVKTVPSSGATPKSSIPVRKRG